MQTPSAGALPAPLAQAARSVAERLAGGGWRAWVVGGAVRDLALGRAPHDVDMASAATPAEVAGAFARTTAVGKAFGTVLVLDFGTEVQVTTFRAEGAYSDGRHPDQLRFSKTLEEDAQRRDFTCNALYLDPLADEVADPTGGLADLERGVLRCVGDPARRFAEDGLRLFRLARFAAELGLAVEPETLEAARQALGALRGVSAERIYAELAASAESRDPGRAFGLLAAIGALERSLPGWGPEAQGRLGVLARLRPGAGLVPWLAALTGGAAEPLQALRAPKAVVEGVERLARLGPALQPGGAATRGARIRLVRDPSWPALVDLARARGGAAAAGAETLEQFRAQLRPEELFPAPLLASSDLAAAGVKPGPNFGALVEELESLQLEGQLATRADAQRWLAERLGPPA